MSQRRVVITGLGPITCIGKGVEGFWNGIRAEKTGISPIDNFDVSGFGVRVAGLIKDWDPEEFFPAHRLKRLDRYAQIKMQKRLAAVREVNETSRHIENLRSFGSEFSQAKTLEEVEALLSQLSPLYSNTIRSRWPLREGDDPNTWGSRIASGLSAWKPPVRHEEGDEFIEVVDLHAFDQDLARIERLDAMIDRTIKRLMQIKTMKQVHRQLEPKLINVSVSKDLPAQHPI